MSEDRGLSLPSQPSAQPGLPENLSQFSFEIFETLNTKPPRPGLRDGEMFICDGYMPIGPNNLRILWGAGASIYTASGAMVVWFNFGNIADTPYMVALLSNGSVVAVNTQSGMATTIMAANTIINPSSFFGFSQWGSQYLIFAKDQTNGYWLWDGTNLFTAGTMSPQVNIGNAGQDYTSPPTITLQTTGAGTGVRFSPVIMNGSVTQVNVTNPGSGFAVNDFVIATVAGGGSDDQAVLGPISPTVTTGGLSSVIIVNGGVQYTGRQEAIILGGGGSGASVSIALSGGTVTAVSVVNPGTGYTSAPSIILNDPGIPGNPSIPGGGGFVGYCEIAFGQITSIPVSYGGSNYLAAPTLEIIGDGTGAAGIVQMQNGQVVDIVMSQYGSGYTVALAQVTGGNNAANVTPLMMPFGISGTSVEVYQSAVWVTNGAAVSNTPPKNRTIFSAPGSAVDFGDGGGAFASNDSFLRVGYHCLKQSNGFLYLIADSSINYISGVQTTSQSSTSVPAQAITTFGNQNVDPQLGTPWASSVQVFSRNIVFANTIGIFVSYGGAVTKVSLPLDGFYATGPIFGATANFSSAVAEIFGIPVYMLLLPVIDPFTGSAVNKLLMWDGKKWFTSQQDRTLTYVASQEINSVLTAWGTDGTNIFPLFQKPSTGFSKVVQSKLFSAPSYWMQKTALRLNGVVNSYALDQPLAISIDNEKALGTGNAAVSVLPSVDGLSWFNNHGQPISWDLAWGVPGLDVFGPYPIAQQGRMLGLTVQTDASDLALISLNVVGQNYTANV